MTIHAPDSGGQDTGVPVKDHGLAEYLYKRLPGLYREKDAEQGQTVTEVERLLPNLDTSQVIVTVREEYQLQRFLRIFGSACNALRTQLDATLLLLDPDKAEPKWLPELAKLFAWNLNLELPVESQRKELKSVIDLYKRKGRQVALEFLIEQMTDFDYEIMFAKDRLLVSQHRDTDFQVNPDSHVYAVGEEVTLGTKEDQNYYVWGQRANANNNPADLIYGVQYIFLYLTQNLLNPDYLLLTSKIERLGSEFVPWGVELILITDSFYGEEDWESENKMQEDSSYHEEEWQRSHWPWLHSWAPVAVFGTDPTGTTVPSGVPQPDFYYRSFYLYFHEEHESDPPIEIYG